MASELHVRSLENHARNAFIRRNMEYRLNTMEKQQDDFHSIQVSDIIQMCCLNLLTGVCQITDDGFSGQVYLRQGDVVHASAAGMQGETAFYSILRHGYADIEFKEGTHDAQQTINAAWEHLLMEGTRRQDQQVFEEEGNSATNGPTGRSLIRILVKRAPLPRHEHQGKRRVRSRRADFSGLIRKKEMTEECIIDTISDEGVTLRTLGSFSVGERAQLMFKIPPRQEEVTVMVEVAKVSMDTISVEALFINPPDHMRKLIGFFLWNA